MLGPLQHDHTDTPAEAGGWFGHDFLLLAVTAFVVGLAVFAFLRYVLPDWRRRRRVNR